MDDRIVPLRMRPRADGAPALAPPTEALFSFVWARVEEVAGAAVRRRDHRAHGFALGTLRQLSGLRQWLDGTTIGSEVGERYLRRLASMHATHPDYRTEWALPDL